MKALNSDSFFALSRSVLTIAYATAAPAAAPSSVPMICFAAPSPESEVGAVWGTATGSDILLAMLGALEAVVGAFDTTDAVFATSLGGGLDADVRELATLMSSR